MTKQINTTRFGTVSFKDDYVIRFRDGMVGFPDLKNYVLVESPQMPLVLWLQSTEDSNVAFPLIEPEFVRKGYSFSMNTADESMISYTPTTKLKTFLVMTIPTEVEQMTVNLRAPVVINIDQSCGGQIILQDKAQVVRAPVFTEFQLAMNSLAAFELTDGEPKWAAHDWRESARREMTA